ncbi:MAG: hypothetical protein K0S44_1258, partial [Bacteroidetes bacterium]|nr:hypothetical protein [Bacteroidota bacterium]
NYRLIKSNVRNFFSNPMRYRDYSQVYLKDVVPTTAGAEAKKEEGK